MNYLTDDGLEAYLEDYNSLYSNYITTTFAYTSKIEEFIHNLSLEMTEIASAKEEKDNKNQLLSVNYLMMKYIYLLIQRVLTIH